MSKINSSDDFHHREISTRKDSLIISGGQPSAYLNLFSENEKLRQSLHSDQQSLRSLQLGAAKALLRTIVRSKRRMTCRTYLDRWIQANNFESYRSFQIQQSIDLKV